MKPRTESTYTARGMHIVHVYVWDRVRNEITAMMWNPAAPTETAAWFPVIVPVGDITPPWPKNQQSPGWNADTIIYPDGDPVPMPG